MVDLGRTAPDFALLDVVSGETVSRDATSTGSGLLVMFVCPHCPYVKHVEAELGRIGRDYAGKIGIVAINANDVAAYPEDGPEQMKEQAAKMSWTFPYLYDESQAVALEYGAACTPDFFLYDAGLRLVYRGQLDGSRPRRGDSGNDVPVTGVDLRRALDDVIAGRTPDAEQKTSLGCNIKWKTA
jgi:thiol-disulfide isomerase/thioredoxin